MNHGGDGGNRTRVLQYQHNQTTRLVQHCFSMFRNIKFDVCGNQTYKQPGLRVILNEL